MVLLIKNSALIIHFIAKLVALFDTLKFIKYFRIPYCGALSVASLVHYMIGLCILYLPCATGSEILA